MRGEPFAPPGPREAIASGVAYVPGDRKSEGILPERSVRENMSLSALEQRFVRRGVVDRAAEREGVRAEFAERARLRAPSLEEPIASLSGGNQQKAVLARCLMTEPDVLLLDDPTRGVDVGAKQEVQAQIKGLAGAGDAASSGSARSSLS